MPNVRLFRRNIDLAAVNDTSVKAMKACEKPAHTDYVFLFPQLNNSDLVTLTLQSGLAPGQLLLRPVPNSATRSSSAFSWRRAPALRQLLPQEVEVEAVVVRPR